MQIIFSGKRVDVTPALKEYAEAKLIKLSRFFDHVQEIHVVESILRNQHIVEVTLRADGTVIRAEERTPDMYTSIDLVIDKLERQLERYKSRFITRTHGALNGHKPTEMATAEPSASGVLPVPPPLEDELPEIVRVKRFPVKPMSPEEACLKLELIGHDFYVFRNDVTDEVNVIYRRRDGHYGLIEPQID